MAYVLVDKILDLHVIEHQLMMITGEEPEKIEDHDHMHVCHYKLRGTHLNKEGAYTLYTSIDRGESMTLKLKKVK